MIENLFQFNFHHHAGNQASFSDSSIIFESDFFEFVAYHVNDSDCLRRFVYGCSSCSPG